MSQQFTTEEIDALNERFESAPPDEILRWAGQTFGNRLVVASSFGAEDVVLIDLASKVLPDIRVFTLDTGRLHQETYNVIDAVRLRYGLTVEVVFPIHDAVQQLVAAKGPNSFYDSVENRKECCFIRKVEPLRRVLKTADAVTGLRRDQNANRQSISVVEIDEGNHNIVKLNPLASWSSTAVWHYIREHNVPVNALHAKGFPSIGCAPCTRAVRAGEDERAGRWWWETPEHNECGLHVRPESATSFVQGGGI